MPDARDAGIVVYLSPVLNPMSYDGEMQGGTGNPRGFITRVQDIPMARQVNLIRSHYVSVQEGQEIEG